ncbi:transketolase [Clostridium drakei]|uniref:Transketolase n=1 Tax=Clostridium drakei TaxID=332101 RepID=A0A2U8DTT1_9CLOT|nr:1-deoxy-D-xylulose-5-phosphate synthase N-terminal domain-containing protein [Clostridium drakei]AWI06157.1 transketolase [Clostridium drakei]
MGELKDTWEDEVYKVANRIRLRVLKHTIENNGGYLSQACSSAEILSTLYLKVLNLNEFKKPIVPPKFPGTPGSDNKNYFNGGIYNGERSEDTDRFILSPAQYALVLYAALIEVGRMDTSGLDEFNKDGSSVEMIGAEHSPGMEVTTGSLGQGISQAGGIALARKLKKEKGRVVVFLSDGECQSGQFWEAVQAISYHKLDNIIAYVDINGYQCDGKMTTVMNIEPFHERLKAFGARVFRIDGHDVDAISALGNLKPDGRPTFILCDTNPSRGINILNKRKPKFHYVRFKSEEERESYRKEFNKLSKKFQ